MKFKLFAIFTTVLLLISGIAPGSALAGAYETDFITSITYQNIDTQATNNLLIYFYDSPTDTTPIEIVRPNLAAGASTSLFIGGLSEITSGFQGSAVMTSDRRLVATLVQLPQNSTTVRNRPLSNGFAGGTQDTLIATVLKNAFGSHQYTTFSVQNSGSTATDVSIKFYNTTATLVHTINQNLQPGASYFVDAGTVAALGTTFNGSVVIQSTGGSIVSSAMELDSGTATGAKAFEGLGQGSTTFYMPSALCNYVTPAGKTQNTNYAVQNTSLTTSTDVTVTYSNGATQSATIDPGAKASFNTCAATGMSQNFNGSATVDSNTTPVIAVGKAAGGGLSTAYVGFTAGSDSVALPYVRWATSANYFNGSQQRVNIALQNVGGSPITGDILVQYIDRDGALLGTHTITTDLAPGAKANSNPTNAGLSEFGVYGPGQFGGGALIIGPAGSQLAAIARVSSYVVANGDIVGEDYNGMPTNP